MHKITSAMIVALLILRSTEAGLASSSMRLVQGGTCNLTGNLAVCRTQSDQCSASCRQSTNTRQSYQQCQDKCEAEYLQCEGCMSITQSREADGCAIGLSLIYIKIATSRLMDSPP